MSSPVIRSSSSSPHVLLTSSCDGSATRTVRQNVARWYPSLAGGAREQTTIRIYVQCNSSIRLELHYV